MFRQSLLRPLRTIVVFFDGAELLICECPLVQNGDCVLLNHGKQPFGRAILVRSPSIILFVQQLRTISCIRNNRLRVKVLVGAGPGGAVKERSHHC